MQKNPFEIVADKETEHRLLDLVSSSQKSSINGYDGAGGVA